MASLLCGFGIAVSLEGIDFHSARDLLTTLAVVFAGGLVCVKGLARFRFLLARAETLASRSTCGACQAYAKFRVVDESARFKVRCRKCGNEWRILGEADEDGPGGKLL